MVRNMYKNSWSLNDLNNRDKLEYGQSKMGHIYKYYFCICKLKPSSLLACELRWWFISKNRVCSAQIDKENTANKKTALARGSAPLSSTNNWEAFCVRTDCARRIIRRENHSQVLVFIRSASAQRKTFFVYVCSRTTGVYFLPVSVPIFVMRFIHVGAYERPTAGTRFRCVRGVYLGGAIQSVSSANLWRDASLILRILTSASQGPTFSSTSARGKILALGVITLLVSAYLGLLETPARPVEFVQTLFDSTLIQTRGAERLFSFWSGYGCVRIHVFEIR